MRQARKLRLARFQLRQEGQPLQPHNIGMLVQGGRKIAIDPSQSTLDMRVRELRGKGGHDALEMHLFDTQPGKTAMFAKHDKSEDSVATNIRELQLYKSRGVTTEEAARVMQDALRRDRVTISYSENLAANVNACQSVHASPPISELDVRMANKRYKDWLRSGSKASMKEYARKKSRHHQNLGLKTAKSFVQLAPLAAGGGRGEVFGERLHVRALNVPVRLGGAGAAAGAGRADDSQGEGVYDEEDYDDDDDDEQAEVETAAHRAILHEEPDFAARAAAEEAARIRAKEDAAAREVPAGRYTTAQMKHILQDVMSTHGFVNYFDRRQCADGENLARVLWNIVASVRVATGPREVAIGDLVAPSSGVDGSDYKFARLVTPRDFDAARYERLQMPSPLLDPASLVVVRTAAEARRHRMCDVVLPVPLLLPPAGAPAGEGHAAVAERYPTRKGVTRDAYETLAAAMLGGQRVGGCTGYRHVITRPFMGKAALTSATRPLEQAHFLVAGGRHAQVAPEHEPTRTAIDVECTLLYGTSRAALLHQLFDNVEEF